MRYLVLLLFCLTLYPNNLKSREFDKEAPQNFRSGRATIAERQGASEDENSEAKPTRSKTDFSGCSGIRAKTIGIFCPVQNTPAWDPESIQSGVTGSQEAVIYMSQELANLGHEVIVFGQPPQDSKHSKQGANPLYVPVNTQQKGMLDIAIAWRFPTLASQAKSRAHKVYLWPHDTWTAKLSDEEIQGFDDVFWLSSWQRAQWVSYNPGFAKYQHIVGNGVELSQFEPVKERLNPYSCIYGSNYARGLEILLDVWPDVKQKHPKATLDIYYGWNHWKQLDAKTEEKMRGQIAQLQKLDVIEHGLVGHQELAQAYAKASFWTYPCTAAETFCISALKAQICGAMPVVITGSALKETVRGGYQCNTREEYLQLLLNAMEHADKITLQDRENLGKFVTEDYTWKAMAKKWDSLFKNKTICLNMIVRTEKKAIARCLDSVKGIIDEWVIVDTGSTDGTQKIVQDCLKEKPGVLYERPWVDFAHNRNEALALAKGRCEYVLLIDADEVLQFSSPFDKNRIDQDRYLCPVRDAKTHHLRTLLLKDCVDWHWKGVVHERIVGPSDHKLAVLSNVVNISNTADGYRSQNPRKYQEDALLLEKELEKDPTDWYSLFFLGQSYVLSKEPAKAIDAFERCAKVVKNPEILWFCHYIITVLNDTQSSLSSENLINRYSEHYKERPSRAEPLYFLAKRAFLSQNFVLSYAMAKRALTIPFPVQDTNSHIAHWIYEYGALCMLADAANNLGKHEEAYEAYINLLKNKNIPNELRNEITEIIDKSPHFLKLQSNSH